jgi:hypothetical protein
MTGIMEMTHAVLSRVFLLPPTRFCLALVPFNLPNRREPTMKRRASYERAMGVQLRTVQGRRDRCVALQTRLFDRPL